MESLTSLICFSMARIFFCLPSMACSRSCSSGARCCSSTDRLLICGHTASVSRWQLQLTLLGRSPMCASHIQPWFSAVWNYGSSASGLAICFSECNSFNVNMTSQVSNTCFSMMETCLFCRTQKQAGSPLWSLHQQLCCKLASVAPPLASLLFASFAAHHCIKLTCRHRC